MPGGVGGRREQSRLLPDSGRTVCRGRRDAQERRVSVLHSVSSDERYIAREHMDVRRDCVNFAHCIIAGAACVNFAQRISTCMGAEVARYLSPGLATSTSVWACMVKPVFFLDD